MLPINGPRIRSLGRMFRRLGQAVDALGIAMQEREAYVEKLVPSTRVVPFKGKSFTYGYEHFIASTASIVGDVTIGEKTSVWYGATVKGDLGSVTVGRNSSIMDNAMVAAGKAGRVVIGNDVTISSGAFVQSAEIGDGTVVGMGAMIMPGAKIGSDSFIDAGALVPSGTVVPSGVLWTGRPARQLRLLTVDEMSYLRSLAVVNASLGETHAAVGARSVVTIEKEVEEAALKRELGLEPSATLPTPPPDVVEYYKLTAQVDNSGLFREHEYDLAAETALREAAEVEADKIENAYYAAQARLRRVGAALKSLSGVRATKADARNKIIDELARMDPEGAALLQEYVARIGAAASGADAEAKGALLAALQQMDPASALYANPAEAAVAAESMFTGVASHSAALGGAPASRPLQ